MFTSRDPRLRLLVLALVVSPLAACGGGDSAGDNLTSTVTPTQTAAATTTAAPTTAPPETTTAPTTAQPEPTPTEPTPTEPSVTTPAIVPFGLGIAVAPGTPEGSLAELARGAELAADSGAVVSYDDSEQPAAALRNLAADNEVVLTVGIGFQQPLTEVAGEFPDTVFVLLDGFVEAPNVVSTTIALREAAFLVGAAAALVDQTGWIGFLGALPMPGVTTLEAGFVAGAAAANPDVGVEVQYLGEAGDFSTFNDPDRAQQRALVMYRGDVDVLFHAAGASGTGVFSAALEERAQGNQVWAIGVDFDQAAGADPDTAAVILTSAVRDLAGPVAWAAEQYAAGTLSGREVELGLAEGAVRYTLTGGHLDGIVDQLDVFAAGIIDGTIVVPEQP